VVSDVLDPSLPHGYTLARLERVAREAAWGSRWHYLPRAEQADVARFAVLEHLYTCVELGDFSSLVRVGRAAIHAHVVKEMHHHGATPKTSDPGAVPMPRYWTYWRSSSVPTSSPEEPIVEALAVAQIFDRLGPAYQRVLLALAEHDDYDVAAAELGKARHGFETTLSVARKQFLAWWHEGEVPSRVWGKDYRNARRRHDRTDYKKITVTTIRRRRQRRERLERTHQPTDEPASAVEVDG